MIELCFIKVHTGVTQSIFIRVMKCRMRIDIFEKMRKVSANHKKFAQTMTDIIYDIHDDVIKWKRFPRYWPFFCAWMNSWVNNREAGDLIRHRTHYDVTVMSASRVFCPRIALYCSFFCYDGVVQVSFTYSQTSSINRTKSKKRKCFSSRLAVDFAQYIETRC